MTKTKTRRQKPKPGDYFAVRLCDDTYGLGQLRELTNDGQSLVLYRTRAASIDELAVLSGSATSKDAVAVLTIGTLELSRGDWRIIGNSQSVEGGAQLEHPRRGTSYTGETADGFLEAFHGLRPWIEFPATPDWYDALLLPGVSSPANKMVRDAPPREDPKPSLARPAVIPEGEGELHVTILYEGNRLPELALLKKRQGLEAWIEGERLGEVTDAGAGGGVMDVYVQTKRARRSAAAIQAKLSELGWSDVSSIECSRRRR